MRVPVGVIAAASLFFLPAVAHAAGTVTARVSDAPGLRLTLAAPWSVDQIHRAGDVNGDGRDDILVTMWSQARTPAAVVVFGGRRAQPVNLNTIGTHGYYILNSRGQVKPAGDVTGDGKADLYEGAFPVTVIYGKATTTPIDRWKLTAEQGNYADPRVVSSGHPGDFNGDGIMDRIIGGGYRQVRVALGTATAPPTWDGPGFFIRARGLSDSSWLSDSPCSDDFQDDRNIRSLGDVTGDGKDDIGIDGTIVSTYDSQNDTRLIRACVVKGRAATTDVSLRTLAEDGNGFTVYLGPGRIRSTLTGNFSASAGYIGPAGDLDGNGVRDFGVFTSGDVYQTRGLYLFPGGPRSANIDTTKAGVQRLLLASSEFNLFTSNPRLSPIRDLTGDGRGELLVGGEPTGATYSVSGRALSGTTALNNLGTAAIKILPTPGSPPPSSSRTSIVAGDVDGDGRDDVAIHDWPTRTSQAGATSTIHVLWGALR